VFLLILQCLQHVPAEGTGGIRKPQQHQRHQLSREQLMIRKEVQETAAMFQVFQLVKPRKLPRAAIRLEVQLTWTSWHGGRNDCAARSVVGNVRRALKLCLQARRKQHLLCKFAQFHS
jgi:hypothetical protein